FDGRRPPRAPPSFPTRRSSDLTGAGCAGNNGARPCLFGETAQGPGRTVSGLRPGRAFTAPDSPPASRRRRAAAGGHHTGRPLLRRKSTRLNSSHLVISYAVFCL